MMIGLSFMRILHFCLPGIVAAAALPCLAQSTDNIPEALYRPGQQTILTPKEAEPLPELLDGKAIRDDFRTAYKAAKRPRIAVYWNRKFSDQVSDWFVPVRTRSILSGDGNAKWSDGVSVEGKFKGSRTRQVELRNVPDTRRKLPERPLAAFEDAFYKEFLEVGTKLVDRSAIIRLARNDLKGAMVRESGPELQVLETEALKDYADLLMELIFIGHGKAKYNAAVRVTVKQVLTGQVVASHYLYLNKDKKKTKSMGELVSGPGGFYRKPAEPEYSEPTDLAQRLALETMQQMNNKLKL